MCIDLRTFIDFFNAILVFKGGCFVLMFRIRTVGLVFGRFQCITISRNTISSSNLVNFHLPIFSLYCGIAELILASGFVTIAIVMNIGIARGDSSYFFFSMMWVFHIFLLPCITWGTLGSIIILLCKTAICR